MRILHVASHLNVGGIPRYVLTLVQLQVAGGHQVVIASGGGQLEEWVKTMGIRHWPLPFHTSTEFSLPVFWGARQLEARLKREPVDVIHAHTRVGQVVADWVSRRLKLPYVTTWHGIYKPRFGRRLWPCTGGLVIAISGPVREHLLKGFHVPEERIRLVYNGVDTAHYAAAVDPSALQEYRRRHQIPEDRPTIGAIGRLAAGRVKGFDSILVAVYLLKETFSDLEVLIVGDGPRRPFLEDVARRLGVMDQVRFLGTSEDIRLPLAAMDLFVFPSRWPEAFGLTLVEAMAAGKPVVATRMGAVPEIVRDRVDGWLVPSEDPAALADGIARLLKDRQMAHRFGRQGQSRVREQFSLRRMAAEVEAVYREVIGSG